jgi:hypothetical protein
MDYYSYWLGLLEKTVTPVFTNLSGIPETAVSADRIQYVRLEALARSLTGAAPFFECKTAGREAEIRQKLAGNARNTLSEWIDRFDFITGGQPLVEAAFLSHAFLRSPRALWGKLDSVTKEKIIKALKSTHKILPCYNNWLLFSAMVETFLYKIGEEYDRVRVDYAVRQHLSWYKGGGVYGDGPEFHWDYYNSFVISPMLLDIAENTEIWENMRPEILSNAQKYAEALERLISPEGTFPPLGRSLAYRCGAFHLLAQLALKSLLPDSISPAQVRCGMTAVLKRILESAFDENGYLTIGFCGAGREKGDSYINGGSVYLCTTAFLPLGLPRESDFWTSADEAWTSVKFWGN